MDKLCTYTCTWILPVFRRSYKTNMKRCRMCTLAVLKVGVSLITSTNALFKKAAMDGIVMTLQVLPNKNSNFKWGCHDNNRILHNNGCSAWSLGAHQKWDILTLASVWNTLKLANKVNERDRVSRDCCTMCLTNLA
mgnify:CR=1 FL=1